MIHENFSLKYDRPRPSKQCEFCIYLHNKSFRHSLSSAKSLITVDGDWQKPLKMALIEN